MVLEEMRSATNTIYVELPNSWSISDYTSAILAIIGFGGLTFAYLQYRQGKKDNATLREVMVGQINREGKLKIYSDALASLRTLFIDWEQTLKDLKVILTPTDLTEPSGEPICEVSLDYESFSSKTSEFPKDSPSVSAVFTYEHKSQMDLVGSPKVGDLILDWLIDFRDLQTAAKQKFQGISDTHRQVSKSGIDLENEIDAVKQEVEEDLAKLRTRLDDLQTEMMTELDLQTYLSPKRAWGIRHRKLKQ